MNWLSGCWLVSSNLVEAISQSDSFDSLSTTTTSEDGGAGLPRDPFTIPKIDMSKFVFIAVSVHGRHQMVKEVICRYSLHEISSC
ncbi:hypothetical protein P5673_006379 [Acropora cervicornis]|uniref:Uncharacterized protein n=1 Tax=Acropora cervicornis TaxID=6130 RepID=A0AAD9QXX9_ACRCE|nr:hypothetical protein P5673_006379 [Acropora cervicornis]